jgi:transposase
MADRIDINGYGKEVAKAAALDVHHRMAPAWRQAKRLPALEKQVRQQAAIIERLQAAVDALKRALAAILGTAVDLDSLEGLKALHGAVVAFKQQKPTTLEPDPPEPPAPIHLAPRAGRRGAAPDRRVGGP